MKKLMKNVETSEPKRSGRPKKVIEPVEVAQSEPTPVVETPKKRGGRPKKAANQVEAPVEKKETEKKTKAKKESKPVKHIPIRAEWSDSQKAVKLQYMHVELKLTEGVLGTTPGDTKSLLEYVASKAPDAKSMNEEVAQADEEEMEKKQTTIFPKGWFYPDGNKLVDVIFHQESRAETFDKSQLMKCPFTWNYQIRGFFKDSATFLKKGKYSSGILPNQNKSIDGNIFVFPRRCAWIVPEKMITDDGELIDVNPLDPPINVRPLRVKGKMGEMSTIASSEELPAGSILKFTIGYMDPALREAIIAWLDYGSIHGLGAWRNSGKGTFIWREIKEDYTPYTPEDLAELEATQKSDISDEELSKAAEAIADNIGKAKELLDSDEDVMEDEDD